jgi:signal peptidase II
MRDPSAWSTSRGGGAQTAMQTDLGGLPWVWLSLAIILFDQLTKYLAAQFLPAYGSVAVLPSLNLTLMHNTGMAFSLLHEAGGWQRWVLSGAALAVSGVILVWLRRLPRRGWLPFALAMILGGALGNLWDRVVLGYVIDFIDVYYRHWHWPAFNVADSAISTGAVVFIIASLKEGRLVRY